MTDVISTLVTFALFFLKPHGRLVFFLPTNNEEYRDVDIPRVPGLKLVANSSQSFGKWARRLITMEKVDDELAAQVVDGLDRGITRAGMDDLESRLRAMKVAASEGIEAEGEGEESAKGGERRRPGHAGFRDWYFDDTLRRKTERLRKEEEEGGALTDAADKES